MNIQCALLERVGHDGVDKLYDRRFIDESCAGVGRFLGFRFENLNIIVFVGDVAEQALHLRFA